MDEGEFIIGTKQYNYNTLEPKLLKANKYNLSFFNSIFKKNYSNIEDLQKYMKNNKTEVALAIFNFDKKIIFPEYIMEAIKNE